jgi:hypothetical protein
MRALCGAIITAGALIGLGLTALGFGVRYQGMNMINDNTKSQIGAYTLTFLLVVLFAGLLTGLGIAFLGLAFHHERRLRESEHGLGHVPRSGVTS